ncbi:MAG: hypothetical protein GX221_11410 [Candidatus Riflebacteria bacterium]|nr:hypothetical protein [Candidatus Riflebacteria bacterium]
MKRNVWLCFFSILLACLAWIHVNIIVSPRVKREVTSQLVFKNIPPNVRIKPLEQKVRVKLEGGRKHFIFSTMSYDSYLSATPTVDLLGVPATIRDTFILPVNVFVTNELEVTQTIPTEISVEVIPVATLTFDVNIISEGEMRDGLLADPPVLSPAKVDVSAPLEILTKIQSCEVSLSYSEISNSISESREIRISPLLNEENKEYVTITPPRTNIAVAVRKGYPQRVLPLAKPVFTGELPEGKNLKSWEMSPQYVEISGSTKHLNKIRTLVTEPVDLSNFTEDVTVPLKPLFPDHTFELISTSTPILQLFLEDIPVTKQIAQIPVTALSSPQQRITFKDSNHASLEIKGLMKDLNPIINHLDKSKLIKPLSLKELAPGTHKIKLELNSDFSNNIEFALTPEFVTCDISLVEQHETTIPETKENKEPQKEDNGL